MVGRAREGREVSEMGKGGERAQTSNYKITKS